MITKEDVIGMTDLSPEEIDAIAEHECLDDCAAAALSDYLMHKHKGPQVIARMISEDIREALHKGQLQHARELYGALHHFLATHPEAERGA